MTLYRQQARSSRLDTEELPEFGEGSAYRYRQREEMKRRRRHREQNVNKLPWFLEIGNGDNCKKYVFKCINNTLGSYILNSLLKISSSSLQVEVMILQSTD